MYSEAQKYLSEYGIRPSLQRMAVMDYLIRHKTHPTAEEIYSALAPGIPTLSRTTVYNTLSMLADRGAILSLDIDGGRMHYDGDTTPHAHFICTCCGAIHDIMLDEMSISEYSLTPPPGATITNVQIYCKGICSKCNKQNDQTYN